MSLTALQATPPVGGIDVLVELFPVGTPDGTELRYYLASAPAGSALVTLENYAARGLDRAAARLAQGSAKQGQFTPDVPGLYAPEVVDVTVYNFLPHYLGDLPVAGQATQIDNEQGALPAYAGGFAQAPVLSVPVWVSQTVSRPIGLREVTATLHVRCYSDRVAAVEGAVVLRPGSAPASKVAVYSPLVLAILDRIAAVDVAGSVQLVEAPTVLGFQAIAWNYHTSSQTWTVHTAADTTNALASAAGVAATASSIKTRLDDVVAKYNAHRTLGSAHPVADSHAMVAMPCGTEGEAVAYFAHVSGVLQAHGTKAAPHVTTTSQVVDGYFGRIVEPPASLDEVAQAINGASGTQWASYGLTGLYEGHRTRVTVEIHRAADGLAADGVNDLFPDNIATLGGAISTANKLADAMNRHIQNLDAVGQAAATPYHRQTAARTRLVQKRASDASTLGQLIEEIWIAIEDHLWAGGPTSGYVGTSTGQHRDRAFGHSNYGTQAGAHQPLLTRLVRAFDAALSPTAALPAGASPLPARLLLRSGWSPSLPESQPCLPQQPSGSLPTRGRRTSPRGRPSPMGAPWPTWPRGGT